MNGGMKEGETLPWVPKASLSALLTIFPPFKIKHILQHKGSVSGRTQRAIVLEQIE